MKTETKLTMVTLQAAGLRITEFLNLPLNNNGQPILPAEKIHGLFLKYGVWLGRGDTVSIG